jgi:hypothetical protein
MLDLEDVTGIEVNINKNKREHATKKAPMSNHQNTFI